MLPGKAGDRRPALTRHTSRDCSRRDGRTLVELVGAAEAGGGFEEGYDAISGDVDLGDQSRIDVHFG